MKTSTLLANIALATLLLACGPNMEQKNGSTADVTCEINTQPLQDSYVLSEQNFPNPQPVELNNEEYSKIKEEGFLAAQYAPYSTFSIDVDGASYSNARRMLKEGLLPPDEAVRIEEWIN